MKREKMVAMLNEQAPIDPQWSMLDLVGVVAVGFNELGGGVGNTGVFLFSDPDQAREFINGAPVTRSIEWLEEE